MPLLSTFPIFFITSVLLKIFILRKYFKFISIGFVPFSLSKMLRSAREDVLANAFTQTPVRRNGIILI